MRQTKQDPATLARGAAKAVGAIDWLGVIAVALVFLIPYWIFALYRGAVIGLN